MTSCLCVLESMSRKERISDCRQQSLQVFDFHHHKFCTGGLTEKEAFFAALTTWPKGVRPVVHWSESQVRLPALLESMSQLQSRAPAVSACFR